jgi:large subunit ribosomal protein L16
MSSLLKFKKFHNIRITKNFLKKPNKLVLFHSTFGLQALESGRITPKQFESARRVCSRQVKNKDGKLWAYKSKLYTISKKPNEMRMGKGKGNLKFNVHIIKKGAILYEIQGLSYNNGKIILSIMGSKLPIKTRFFIRKFQC